MSEITISRNRQREKYF